MVRIYVRLLPGDIGVPEAPSFVLGADAGHLWKSVLCFLQFFPSKIISRRDFRCGKTEQWSILQHES